MKNQHRLTDNPLIPSHILYGGAFDPPHQGHIDCLRLTAHSFPESKILVVPGVQPAGSSNTFKDPRLTFRQRVGLCKKAFEGIKESVSVSEVEQELPKPNYTVRTLSHIKETHPEARLGLLVGQDQLKDFHLWFKPKEILKMASLIVIKRDSPDFGFGGILAKSLSRLADHLEEPFQWTIPGSQASFPGLSTAIFLIDHSISIANSTMIREFISNGQKLPDGWMPDALYDYIQQKQFYEPTKTELR